ncbi:hypothetical protein FOZ62_022839 [Perkinsus olseni]|uniref:Uncharacterized protein n=1 Tax=Perkinsus olseni TaxID=32597 RepID=A0A7J6NDS1_PEROL|nr:hypothetical protein FOZ62_022839 [Perkinsus olseni]
MGNRHNDRRLCLPPSTTIPEGIAVEGVSSSGIANRPRRSTIGMRVVEDNPKLDPTHVVPQDRISDTPQETVKVDTAIGAQLDGRDQREVDGQWAELDHLSADGRNEHDDMLLAVEHIASPVRIPSTTTTLLRAYGGIGLLGEIVDRLWSRSLTDPRLRMRLLAYQTQSGDAHDDQRPPSVVRKSWMHILAHSLLATTPSEGSQNLTYLLLRPPTSLSYDTAAFAILPTTEYHLSALLENFAMVSQDIAATVNDNQPTNKDIAKAIRAIIDTSTPLIISSPPSSRSGSTIDPFDAPLYQNGSEGLCGEESCTTCCLYTATATPFLAVCSPLLSLCLTPTIITQHPIECGHDVTNQQRHHHSTTSSSLLALLGGVEGITRLVNRTVELIGADTRIRAYYIRNATSQATSPSVRPSTSTTSRLSSSQQSTVCVVARIIPPLIDYLVAKISCYSTFDGFHLEEMRTTVSVSQAHRFLPLSDYHFDCVCQDFHTALTDCGVSDTNVASQFGVVLESCREDVLKGHYERKPSPWQHSRRGSDSDSTGNSSRYSRRSRSHVSSPKEIFNRRAIATSSDDLIPSTTMTGGPYYFMDNQRTAGWAEVHSGGRIIELDTARSAGGRKEKVYSRTIAAGSR